MFPLAGNQNNQFQLNWCQTARRAEEGPAELGRHGAGAVNTQEHERGPTRGVEPPINNPEPKYSGEQAGAGPARTGRTGPESAGFPSTSSQVRRK